MGLKGTYGIQRSLRSLTPPFSMGLKGTYGIQRSLRSLTPPFSMGFKGNDEFPLTCSL